MAKSSEGKSGRSEPAKEASLALMTDANNTEIQAVQGSYTSLKSHTGPTLKHKGTRKAERKNTGCEPWYKAHPLPSAQPRSRSDKQGVRDGGYPVTRDAGFVFTFPF